MTEDYLLTVQGEPFRCTCGCNVFRKSALGKLFGNDKYFVCNGCQTFYYGLEMGESIQQRRS